MTTTGEGAARTPLEACNLLDVSGDSIPDCEAFDLITDCDDGSDEAAFYCRVDRKVPTMSSKLLQFKTWAWLYVSLETNCRVSSLPGECVCSAFDHYLGRVNGRHSHDGVWLWGHRKWFDCE